MKTLTLAAAILFCLSLKSQTIYRGTIAQTFLLVNNDWSARDSIIGKFRKITVDTVLKKVKYSLEYNVEFEYAIVAIQKDSISHYTNIYTQSDNGNTVMVEFPGSDTEQMAVYYLWDNTLHAFLKSELITLNKPQQW